jgi:hypothetical protein
MFLLLWGDIEGNFVSFFLIIVSLFLSNVIISFVFEFKEIKANKPNFPVIFN